MTADEFFLGLRRRAGLLQQTYDGPSDDADEETWAKRIADWRLAQAKIAADNRKANKKRAEAEEMQRAAAAVGLVLVTDEKLIAAVEATVPEKE